MVEQITIYNANGSIKNIYFLKNSRLHGTDTYYDKNGEINLIETWKDGKRKGLAEDFFLNKEIFNF